MPDLLLDARGCAWSRAQPRTPCRQDMTGAEGVASARVCGKAASRTVATAVAETIPLDPLDTADPLMTYISTSDV